MEVRALQGRFHISGANREISKTLARFSGLSVVPDDGAKQRNQVVLRNGIAVELVQAGAIKRCTEVNVVDSRSFPDQTDFSQVRAGTAVGAPGHADHDLIVPHSALFHDIFELRN